MFSIKSVLLSVTKLNVYEKYFKTCMSLLFFRRLPVDIVDTVDIYHTGVVVALCRYSDTALVW